MDASLYADALAPFLAEARQLLPAGAEVLDAVASREPGELRLRA